MTPLQFLERSDQSLIYKMPSGKPDPSQACVLGADQRKLVTQAQVKTQQIWYYTFNFIRQRVGKNPNEELKNAREIEVRCSKLRKERGICLETFPAVVQSLNNDAVRESLSSMDRHQAKFLVDNWAEVGSKIFETPEVLEGCPSIFPFLKEFIRQNSTKNMYEFFVKNYWEKRGRTF